MSTQFLRKFTSVAQINPLYGPDDAGVGVADEIPYLNPSGAAIALALQPLVSRTWFVDATASADGGVGNDANSGRSWSAPFLTMQAAFDALRSGDVIRFKGKVREQLTTPVQIFDVTIVGEGNRPRHADDDPSGSSFAANTWTTPASGATTAPLVDVLQQGWRFVNVLFAGPSDHSCVRLFRNGGAADAERDASHAEFWNCRFASGQDGIEDSGGCGHVGIYGSYFTDLTGVAIKQTTGAGIGQPYFRWDVRGNRIQDCPSLTTAKAAQFFRFKDNTVSFAGAVTLGFDFTGGKQNQVIGNVFNVLAADFDPAGGFTGTATDNWSNTLEDAIETGLPAN